MSSPVSDGCCGNTKLHACLKAASDEQEVSMQYTGHALGSKNQDMYNHINACSPKIIRTCTSNHHGTKNVSSGCIMSHAVHDLIACPADLP